MELWQTILSVVLIVIGVVVIAAVLLQQGKAHGLSGAIAGGAETFFGKEKGKKLDRVVSKWTTIISVAFVLVVLLLYILLPNIKQSLAYTADYWSISPYNSTEVTQMVGEEK